MKTANIMSKFMATTVSTCFRAWKLYHRTLKDAAGVIKAQENKMLLGRYGWSHVHFFMLTDGAYADSLSECLRRYHARQRHETRPSNVCEVSTLCASVAEPSCPHDLPPPPPRKGSSPRGPSTVQHSRGEQHSNRRLPPPSKKKDPVRRPPLRPQHSWKRQNSLNQPPRY